MNAWLVQHFFNPSFVLPWGAALVVSPIIIHLINRMRFRRVKFAAMEFLLQSQQRNRRRLLFEQLLLLLLRILIVVGLLALIARLILDPNQLSIFRGTKAHHIVLLDDSGSMRNRWGETTAFAAAKDVVKQIVKAGARRPDTQQLTLLLLSNLDRPLFTQLDVNETLIGKLETKLKDVPCSYRTLDLASGLDAARKIFADEKTTLKHLHVVSDFRRADWEGRQATGNAIRMLDDAAVTVNLVKTVPRQVGETVIPYENLAVTQLFGDLHSAAAGVPLRLIVGVKNFGEQVAHDVVLSIFQDGQKLPRSERIEKIEAGVEVFHDFDVTFEAPTKHALQVQLDSDALDQDNTRFLTTDVAEINSVLVVDGDPSHEGGRFVAEALAPIPRLTGLAPQIADVDFLRKRPLEKFQNIIMLNISELPQDAIVPLEQYVASGGGLAWFVGNAVKPAFYNDRLYRAGQGLFPVPLALSRRKLNPDDGTTPGPDLIFADHPMLVKLFGGQDNPYVEFVNIDSYLPVSNEWSRDDNERKDDVSTICVLRNKQPLMFDHRYGKGRVVTTLTTAGPVWNNWAKNPSYPAFLLEMQKYIARNDRTLERRIVGEPIAFSLDPAEYTAQVEVAPPDSNWTGAWHAKATLTDSGAPTSDAELRLEQTYRDTDVPGIYAVKLLDLNQIAQETWIAYNVPLEESDLEPAATELIRKQIGEDVRVQIQEPGVFDWVESKEVGQEVRKWLLVALLIVLLAEQLLAYKLSYHPKVIGKTA